MIFCKFVFIFCMFCACFSVNAQSERTLFANKDNTIYSESSTTSNGSGDFLFAGKIRNGSIRRALFQFSDSDLNSLVTGKNIQIDSVAILIKANRTNSGSPQSFKIHRLLKNWGEGTSNAISAEGTGATAAVNDATWANSFFKTNTWNTPGGDYVSTPSATFTANSLQLYEIKSNQLTSDVKQWIQGLCCTPSNNFGWILIGNESVSTTAFRFISSENSINEGPKLKIYYTNKGGGLGIESENTSTQPFAFYNSELSEIQIENMEHTTGLILYDLAGNKVLESKSNRINASALPKGVYIIKSETDFGVFKQKIALF